MTMRRLIYGKGGMGSIPRLPQSGTVGMHASFLDSKRPVSQARRPSVAY